MPHSTRLAMVGLLLLASAAGAQSPATLRTEVQSFVKAYADAANRADVNAYVEMYKQSPDLLSVDDGEIKRGWSTLRDQANQILGQEGNFRISVDSIDVVPLGTTRAIAVAPYVITIATQGGPAQLAGVMTLVLEKAGGKWLIVHDHTSTKPAAAE